VLGIDRSGVLAHPEAPVGDGQVGLYRKLVGRRATGEPMAYIRSVKEFHGLAFTVDPRVLIPRPDTELLVDLAEQSVRDALTKVPPPLGSPPLQIWDVGTGSGAIAVSLAVSLRRRGLLDVVRMLASDSSRDALAVALDNAVAHGVADRVELRVGDLLAVDDPPARVDLLLANLPYIPSDVVPMLAVAARFEPSFALDGGPDGLGPISRLLASVSSVVCPGGRLLLEIGSDQAIALRELSGRLLPGWPATVHQDLGSRPRVLQLDRPHGVPA
jgi:release factor glutamine methyltransferase